MRGRVCEQHFQPDLAHGREVVPGHMLGLEIDPCRENGTRAQGRDKIEKGDWRELEALVGQRDVHEAQPERLEHDGHHLHRDACDVELDLAVARHRDARRDEHNADTEFGVWSLKAERERSEQHCDRR